VLWNGLENLSSLYGLDIANSLTTADVTATTSDETHATVKLGMNFAGQPLAGEWPMVKQAGHWYDATLLEAWQKAHPAATAAASATSTASAAATAAGPASSATTPAPSAKPAAAGTAHR
jgi:hypothetical protein